MYGNLNTRFVTMYGFENDINRIETNVNTFKWKRDVKLQRMREKREKGPIEEDYEDERMQIEIDYYNDLGSAHKDLASQIEIFQRKLLSLLGDNKKGNLIRRLKDIGLEINQKTEKKIDEFTSKNNQYKHSKDAEEHLLTNLELESEILIMANEMRTYFKDLLQQSEEKK